jgi:hypothetical protein
MGSKVEKKSLASKNAFFHAIHEHVIKRNGYSKQFSYSFGVSNLISLCPRICLKRYMGNCPYMKYKTACKVNICHVNLLPLVFIQCQPFSLRHKNVSNANIALGCLQKCLPLVNFIGTHCYHCRTNGKKFCR